VEHFGSFQNLGNAWSAANQYVRNRTLKQGRAGAFEFYINNSQLTAVDDLRIETYLPLTRERSKAHCRKHAALQQKRDRED